MASDYNEEERKKEVESFLESLQLIPGNPLITISIGEQLVDRVQKLEAIEHVAKQVMGNNPNLRIQMAQENFMLCCGLLLLRSVSFFLNKKWWEISLADLEEYMTKHLGGVSTKRKTRDIMDQLIETIEASGIVTENGIIPIKRETGNESKDN